MDLSDNTKTGSIDPAVAKLALEFAQGWTDIFRDLPRYQLDFSWPSITTVGMLIEIMRANGNRLTPEVTCGVAAYLAVMAAGIWQVSPVGQERCRVTVKHPGTRVTAFLQDSGQSDRILYDIALEEALAAFLDPARTQIAFPPSALDTLPHFSPLRRFAYELFCGLSPLGSGTWLDSDNPDLTSRMVSFDLSLATGTADFCRRVYPAEDLLHSAKLFTTGVLTPPASFNEPVLLGRSALSLLRNLDSVINTDDHQRRKNILTTLSTINEPQLSAAALIGSIAAIDDPEDPAISRLRRTAFFLEPIRNHLKPAIELARSALQRPAFIDLTNHKDPKDEQISQLNSVLAVEHALEFLPQPTLELDSLRSIPGLLPAYYLSGTEHIERFLRSQPEALLNDPLLIILRARTELLSGNIEGAKLTLAKGKQLLPSFGQGSGATSRFLYKLLADTLCLEGDDIGTALVLYEEAEKADPGISDNTISSLKTDQARCKLILGDKDGAEVLLSTAIELDPNNPEALILRADLSRSTEDILEGLRKLPFSLSLLRLKVGLETASRV